MVGNTIEFAILRCGISVTPVYSNNRKHTICRNPVSMQGPSSPVQESSGINQCSQLAPCCLCAYSCISIIPELAIICSISCSIVWFCYLSLDPGMQRFVERNLNKVHQHTDENLKSSFLKILCGIFLLCFIPYLHIGEC